LPHGLFACTYIAISSIDLSQPNNFTLQDSITLI
jgi:hypothetical protein